MFKQSLASPIDPILELPHSRIGRKFDGEAHLAAVTGKREVTPLEVPRGENGSSVDGLDDGDRGNDSGLGGRCTARKLFPAQGEIREPVPSFCGQGIVGAIGQIRKGALCAFGFGGHPSAIPGISPNLVELLRAWV